MKFDAFLYGNGLSINLLEQLKVFIPAEKHYLLNIDDFLKGLINNNLSVREERKVFELFYKKNTIENKNYFAVFKNKLEEYYNKHNSNIELHLGMDMFNTEECGYNYAIIKSIFPFLYNIWSTILLDYLNYLILDSYINNFTESIIDNLSDNAAIFTTNFDLLLENLSPQHLHGRFIRDIKCCQELILEHIDENEFLYKNLWSHNGFSKLNFLDKVKNNLEYQKYYDVDFFYSENVKIENLLIYGISFQKSGHIKAMSEKMDKYKKATLFGIIDEHILARLYALQENNKLINITFSYYNDNEKVYYKELVDLFKLKNVTYIQCSQLLFNI